MNLQEIEKRLQEATGPDRELDALIWAELDGRDVRYEDGAVIARSRVPPHNECLLGLVDHPGRSSRNFFEADGWKPPIPHVTASLDAAIALAERVLPSNPDDGRPWLQLLHDVVIQMLAKGISREHLARLYCLAIIRALIAKEDKR